MNTFSSSFVVPPSGGMGPGTVAVPEFLKPELQMQQMSRTLRETFK